MDFALGSKKLRASRSSTQFTRRSWSPQNKASGALCWLRFGRNPLREAEEVSFVNRVEHFHRCSLNKLVFERRDAERSLPPIRLRNVYPTHRPGSVRSALQPMGEALEIFLKGLAVVLPRLTVHTGCGVPLQLEVSKAQSVDPLDVMQKSGELYILVQCCRLSYPFQRTGRIDPALSLGRVLLARIPLGQTPSLHLLRRRCFGFVRRLPRYYGSVRLSRCSFVIGFCPWTSRCVPRTLVALG
jgi:hypothetical protein